MKNQFVYTNQAYENVVQLQVCFCRESEKLILSYILVKIAISLKINFKLILSSLGNPVEPGAGRTRVFCAMAKLRWAGRKCITCDS